MPADALKADHVVIGEAENLIANLARDLEDGKGRPVYEAAEKPAMEHSPVPDFSLIKMKLYSTMTVQYSRGCPFNCEFCDIIEIYGRQPRMKAVEQVLAELDQLYEMGWREALFVVDDNFIGNKKRAKELLTAMAEWGGTRGYPFRFSTEASLNLADDAELLQLMKDAGFAAVFLGIETPDESSLIANHKLQNTRRDLLGSVSSSTASRSWEASLWASTLIGKIYSTGWWTSSRKALFHWLWSDCCRPCLARNCPAGSGTKAGYWMRAMEIIRIAG
jgi:radical SAM superfamily enzyme YgiQ (UPF0313 family)